MELKQYMWVNEITKTRMSEKLGISRTSLFQVLRGKYCSKRLAKKVEEVTEGEVEEKEMLALRKRRKSKEKVEIKSLIS